MARYWAGGARVVDTSPLYGTAEITVGDYATALGISDRLFIANKIWATGDFLADESHALQSLRTSEGRLWRERIDLMQVHSLVNVDLIVPYLRAWKKEGRIRYLGVTHFENQYFEPLANWIDRGNLDFVQVNYSIFNRQAEERILRSAAERGTAVLTNMPFEKARLFKIVEGRPLPEFARESGITTWAQYFLKWVISHPAVTVALSATANPEQPRITSPRCAARCPMPRCASAWCGTWKPSRASTRSARCRGIPTGAIPASSVARRPSSAAAAEASVATAERVGHPFTGRAGECRGS